MCVYVCGVLFSGYLIILQVHVCIGINNVFSSIYSNLPMQVGVIVDFNGLHHTNKAYSIYFNTWLEVK